ncbi:MAG: CHAD domain-containing protein [Nitrospira sp.]|nr:MAG: CHAD domain-containing protein [Nitrospira sp.]
MASKRSSIHTGPQSPTQGLVDAAASNQATVLRLLRQVMARGEHADTIHAIRTHCRRLQALLELCGNVRRARAMADCVGQLSKLRALQVFRRYLIARDAPQKDLTRMDNRLAKRIKKLTSTDAYRTIEQVVWKQALPGIASPGLSFSDRLEQLRQQHECRLKQLIEAASDKPRRKRLHALRLALKTIRYQTEWLPGRAAAKHDLLSRLKRVQTILGKYEELADFHRWGKKLSPPVQRRITQDWKRARKRARRVPEEMSWLLDALASGHAWIAVDHHARLLNRKSAGSV